MLDSGFLERMNTLLANGEVREELGLEQGGGFGMEKGSTEEIFMRFL